MAAESITVDNPYGIQAMWAQGDYVTKGVLVLLVLMSAYSWFIIFTKWWEQKRLLGQAKEAEKNFWAADNIKSGVTKLTGKGNVFQSIAAEAIDAAEHHDSRHDRGGSAARVDRQRDRARRGPHRQRADDTDCRSSRRRARPRRSSACSARCGASTTRWCRSASPARRASTRSPARWVRR